MSSFQICINMFSAVMVQRQFATSNDAFTASILGDVWTMSSQWAVDSRSKSAIIKFCNTSSLQRMTCMYF